MFKLVSVLERLVDKAVNHPDDNTARAAKALIPVVTRGSEKTKGLSPTLPLQAMMDLFHGADEPEELNVLATVLAESLPRVTKGSSTPNS